MKSFRFPRAARKLILKRDVMLSRVSTSKDATRSLYVLVYSLKPLVCAFCNPDGVLPPTDNCRKIENGKDYGRWRLRVGGGQWWRQPTCPSVNGVSRGNTRRRRYTRLPRCDRCCPVVHLNHVHNNRRFREIEIAVVSSGGCGFGVVGVESQHFRREPYLKPTVLRVSREGTLEPIKKASTKHT